METVKYTTYISHVTATYFCYLNFAVIRMYAELQKGNLCMKILDDISTLHKMFCKAESVFIRPRSCPQI
jgi:hypothetical protein